MNPTFRLVRKLFGAAVLLAVFAGGTISPAESETKAPPPLASRSFDSLCFTRNTAFEVTVNIIGIPDLAYSMLIVENIPDHVSIPSVSDDGVVDLDEGTIVWGPFTTNLDRSVTYYIRPGSSTDDPMVFDGTVSYREHGSTRPVTETTGGSTTIADCNPPTPTATPSPTPQPLGERGFSEDCFIPNEFLTVTIDFPSGPFLGDLYIEETLSPGWVAEKPSDSGVWSAVDRKILWGPFTSAGFDRSVQYRAKSATSKNNGVPMFAGVVWSVVGGTILNEAPIGGDANILECSVTPTPTPTPTPDYPGGREAGDFNDDDCTDLADFLFLLDNWQLEVGGTIMGLDDFLALLDYWQMGPGC